MDAPFYFLWPGMLWGLALLPLLVWAYRRWLGRRRALAARYGSLGGAAAAAQGWPRHLPPALYLAALVWLLLSLARPQAEVSLPRLEGTVILAFDVSRSMAAQDMEPSRIAAARAAALAFVDAQPASVRLGVVAFSNSGLEVQVPTNDQAALRAAIERLAPQRGTALGQGILAALAALAADSDGDPAPTPAGPPGGFDPLAVPPVPNPASTAIIVFSDGENNDVPHPLDAAVAARGQGVRIYTVGLGSPDGTTLDLDGFTVFTQPDEGLLRQIAEITEGRFYRALDLDGMTAVYDDVPAQLVVRAQAMEVTALFAGAGLLCLLLGAALALHWYGRVP